MYDDTRVMIIISYTSRHSRTVPSAPPDATSRPSGLKHTDYT